MDEAGIEMQVLSFTAPGAQGENDPKKAAALAKESNDCEVHLYLSLGIP